MRYEIFKEKVDVFWEQEMWMQLNADRSKYQFLLLVHPAFGMAGVGKADWRFGLRKSLNAFVLSTHKLEIETGRYTRPPTARDQRLCTFCLAQGVRAVGDETHVLDECAQFRNDRIMAWRDIRQVILQPIFQGDKLSELLKELDSFKLTTRMKVWRVVAILVEKIQKSKTQ